MIAHVDCAAGISGDMLLAALVDAGADLLEIQNELCKLNFGNPRLEQISVTRCGIRATLLEVHGAEVPVPGGYEGFLDLLDGAELDPSVLARSRSTLKRLAEAEARVHGLPVAEIHLHELGELDTLVDVVGVSEAFRQLGVDNVSASAVATGHGIMHTAHGSLPLPAPAVLEILKGVPIYGRDVAVELITPTGAALLAEFSNSFGPMKPQTIFATGYGAGRRELEFPNVVRVVLGEEAENLSEGTTHLIVEATIDDMNPELFPYVCERLRESGADDCWVIPVIGKNGRPGQILQVLVAPFLEDAVRAVLIKETTTIGGRTASVSKWMLGREWTTVVVEKHEIRVKLAREADKIVNVAPEYRDCVDAASETGLPLKEVFQRASEEARRSALGGNR